MMFRGAGGGEGEIEGVS